METYVCEFCNKEKTIVIKCSKCYSKYCSEFCSNEDEEAHTKICDHQYNQEDIKKSLKLFEIPEEYEFPIDHEGNKYIHFPGEVQGELPSLMLCIYNRDSFGRKVWKTLNQPIGTLDQWYYIVRLEDLPRMISKLEFHQMINLCTLLNIKSASKK
jgi:hypothetical protein